MRCGSLWQATVPGTCASDRGHHRGPAEFRAWLTESARNACCADVFEVVLELTFRGLIRFLREGLKEAVSSADRSERQGREASF